MTKLIILCADDFGQARHINRGILTLANKNRISAISCMVTCPDWHHQGIELKGLESQVDIGLHFNLTYGEEKHFHTLKSWLVRAMTGQIDRFFVEQILNQQLDRFIHVVGKPPDFVDGHQHIHVLPIIRDSLIKVLKARFDQSVPYVRSTSPMVHIKDSRLKALIIKGISFGFNKALRGQGIRHNPCFGGIYSLQPNKPYRQFMIHWLQQASSGSIIMCHPGIESKNSSNDPHAESRAKEYQYFSSQAFQEDCKEANVVLSRFGDLPVPSLNMG